LLRCIQVERVATDAAAETVWRYVSQRSVLPAVSDGEDESAVSAYENVLLDIAWRRRGTFWFGFCSARASRVPRRGGGGSIRCDFIARSGVFGCGSSFLDNYWRAQEEAAESEGSAAVESAAVVMAIAADCSEMRKIKA
jgi:hypothetical protein